MNRRLREYIQQGHIIITASQRQARYLKHAHTSEMINDGKTAWLSPDILTWKSWIRLGWDQQQLISQSLKLVLNASQSRTVWQSIIDSSPFTKSILQKKPLADAAMHAYELCQEWNIKIFPQEVFLNRDAQAFRYWVESYVKILNQNNWVDVVNVPDYLVTSGFVPDHNGVVLYGFDELTLQQEDLLEHLKAQGVEVVIYQMEGRNKKVNYQGFPNRQAELRAAAEWSKNILRRQADASIGIIVPDLSMTRDAVCLIFDEILHPDWVVNGPETIQRLYNLAPGKPLSGYALIHIALELLSLGQSRHSIQKLEVLLRSSFIKNAESERHDRDIFYAALRQTGEPSWKLKTLLEYINNHRDQLPAAGSFDDMLKELVVFMNEKVSSQSTRQWSETFNAWLKIFGWPGDRKLNSTEYQTIEVWQEALVELASLETVVGRCQYTEALGHLKKILKENSFQPETAETPIQISGLPGVAGLQFDYLRIVGLHNQVWPEPAKVNPFIPLVLQIDAGVPGASAESMVKRCRDESEALIKSSKEVVFSFPEYDDDRECRPSPILKEYLSYGDEDCGPHNISYQQLIFDTQDIEIILDENAPQLSVNDNATGGTGVLADQAACPFRAYARHRLYASGLADINIGINPSVRGQLVHRVLQGLWENLSASENLHQLSDDKKNQLIRSVVETVIRRQTRHQPETFTPAFCSLESQRLQSLLRDWLIIEHNRPAFKIKAVEESHTIEFHGLNLSMRIDRVDELSDGSLVIIDYKTGLVNLGKWQGERPDEPQLPLYAITYEGNVRAVAFAGLKKGKLGFIGLAAEDDVIPGVNVIPANEDGAGWENQIQDWNHVLGVIAVEFAKGRAEVDPKDNNTCQYCDLHSLCRIHELRENHPGLSEPDEMEWNQG